MEELYLPSGLLRGRVLELDLEGGREVGCLLFFSVFPVIDEKSRLTLRDAEYTEQLESSGRDIPRLSLMNLYMCNGWFLATNKATQMYE